MPTRPSIVLLAVLALSPCGIGAVEVDAGLHAYVKVEGLAGNLNCIGSNTLNNLLTFWAEGFQATHPDTTIQIEGQGGTTAPYALISGAAQLGPMSRPMNQKEIDAFVGKFGYKPTAIPVAIDVLAVFVHKDNPLTGLTLAQLDGIFSSTLKRGGNDISDWGDVGLDSWKGRLPSLIGRNSASGSYGFFKMQALRNGDYKKTIQEQPGSARVVQAIIGDPNGIGYSGIGYLTSGVKVLHLGERADALVAPTHQNCLDGSYPFSRFLYLYVNRKPGQPLDPLTGAFIRFALSKQGQEIVIKDGYFPVSATMVEKTLIDLTK